MDGELSPAEVRRILETESVRVVDIRPEAAFERGHIPGSECIPFPRLPSEIERLDGAQRVVTVCPHGVSSVQAARLIASYEGVQGRVESMAGGLDEWGGDLVRGGGDDGVDGSADDGTGATEPGRADGGTGSGAPF